MKNIYKTKLFEKPLDNIVSDGGYTSIFKTICFVGDSLTTGEIEFYLEDENNSRCCYDTFDYAWGTYIGKMTGSDVKFIARGGASASYILEYMKEKFTIENKADAYVIALGYNDMLGYKQPIGTSLDINNPDSKSVIYYYYKLVEELKKLNPDARFFFVNMPKTPDWSKENRQKIKELREMIFLLNQKIENSYVIDLWKYGPIHNTKFMQKYYLNAHLNFEGYYLTAKLICSYIPPD